ncbi:MalY/PatB family protein [Arthrobacter koreensis]|uniref:cysteine-S-conjugate beta-lyase n=1 Tax=Arthrobacter koreensis TaxID=199136 RepID=A0ABY6FQ59_9MICC|nr:aminotransferase class I/II-fold pyridoxal phosphate-dependent enzyme [Arthrobacter koreensis]UYB35350.1 aminotransferase class I/II-fold pyridoxal phosphate-dependent enzyme [Arthrobacter koreensis]
MTELAVDPLDVLRLRTSAKWRTYPGDVLPMFVAEMDYPLAPPVARAMIERIEASDVGYVSGPGPVGPAFAGFAQRRWNWEVDPEDVRTTTDVSVAIVETLRQVLEPGDEVIITPPVYPPFFDLPLEAGGKVREVPLLQDDAGWSLDLDGLETAFSGGARALLLCNPHNPLGLVHPKETLDAVARLAAKYGATVVSDEIHAPLVYSPETFTPFLSVSEEARTHGVCVTAASKGWNIAGSKCALMIASTPETRLLLDEMPEEVGFRTSILGLHGTAAAYADGEEWLDGVLAVLASNRELLRELLAAELPGVGYRMPDASYLAWLDMRALGWGTDPGEYALEKARVALEPGLKFGTAGAGHVRLNFGCAPEVLEEAIHRLSAARS